jgi:hypothetical protein
MISLLAVGTAALLGTCAGIAWGQNDEQIAAQVMTAQYGKPSRDGCWILHTPDLGNYCLKPIQRHRIEAHDGPRVYVLADGLPMSAAGEVEEIGVHAAPGVIGAFALALAGSATAATGGPAARPGAWTYLAASKELRFGSFGRANAAGARFTQIGPDDYYGWVFVSGGTWQGITVGEHVILAARGRRFVDISSIPSITEEDQDHEFDIVFDAASRDGKVYPLEVTRRKIGAGGASGPVEDRWKVTFDEHSWRYRWPPPAH